MFHYSANFTSINEANKPKTEMQSSPPTYSSHSQSILQQRRRQLNNLAVRRSREKQKHKIAEVKREIERLSRNKFQLKLQLLSSKKEYETLCSLFTEISQALQHPHIIQSHTNSPGHTDNVSG